MRTKITVLFIAFGLLLSCEQNKAKEEQRTKHRNHVAVTGVHSKWAIAKRCEIINMWRQSLHFRATLPFLKRIFILLQLLLRTFPGKPAFPTCNSVLLQQTSISDMQSCAFATFALYISRQNWDFCNAIVYMQLLLWPLLHWAPTSLPEEAMICYAWKDGVRTHRVYRRGLSNVSQMMM